MHFFSLVLARICIFCSWIVCFLAIDNSSNGPRSMVSSMHVGVSITLLFKYIAYLEVRSVQARFSQGYPRHPMVDLACPPPRRHLSTFPLTDNIPYRHCKNWHCKPKFLYIFPKELVLCYYQTNMGNLLYSDPSSTIKILLFPTGFVTVHNKKSFITSLSV